MSEKGLAQPFTLLVGLLDTTTQKRRDYHADYDLLKHYSLGECYNGLAWDFMWGEGNYSCDCNRGLFFDGNDYPCGDSRFVVEWIVRKETGENLSLVDPRHEASNN